MDKKISVILGTIIGAVKGISIAGALETVIYAIIGAFVAFFTTLILKEMKNKTDEYFKRRARKNKQLKSN